MKKLFLLIVIFIGISRIALAADVLFPALGAAAAVSGTDIIPCYQGSEPVLGCTAAQIGTFVARPIATVYTSNTATLTLGATNNEIEVIRQGTPAALLINLPVSPATNLYKCVKDGKNIFATFNATVKTTDGTQIDSVAGTTGYVMNQNNQHACFVFDGTMWDIN